MKYNDGFCIVITAVADPESARKLAAIILERRLAACVQWFPITSMYRWKGTIETAGETLLQAKTTAAAAAALQECIRQEHDYETPEIVVLPIAAGLQEYLDWLRNETQS